MYWLLIFLSLTFVVQGEDMLVIGHRGACGHEPENTLLSFKKAVDIGVDMIEFDVQKAKSGQLVVMHDATVNRTTNGVGSVVEMTFAQLRKLDAGKGQKIPTLQEVLDLVNHKIRVDIEIKAAQAVHDVAEIIQDYIDTKGWSRSGFLVSSFDISDLEKFHEHMPEIELMVLFSHAPKNWLEIMKDLPASMLATSYKNVSQELIDLAHSHDIKIIVYTVNDPKDIIRMIKLGVDGICSDYPDRVKHALS